MNLKSLLILGYVLLIGCASNQKFDCPKVGGIRCQSMSEIDQLIDSGKLEEKKAKRSTHKKLYINNKTHYRVPSKINSNTPLRLQEEVIQLWIAAYESQDGIYHHPSELNVVIKPSKWYESEN